MKKMCEKKRNNKGFSLVELIVVILIMAVIAVALAPQVMKWVGRSKESTDKNNIGQIESAVNAGVADYMAENNTATVPEATYNVTSAGLAVVGTVTDPAPAGKTLKECIEEAMNGKYPTVQQDGSKNFQIVIEKTGKVMVSIPGLITPTP